MKRHIRISRTGILGLLLLSLLLLPSCRTSTTETPDNPAPTFGKERGLVTDSFMVVSAHPEASRVGSEILAQGGHAVDAAVGVQFALAVAYPIAGNIGGGGFMVLQEADGEVATLDYREKAPAASHRDMYLDSAGNIIPDLSTAGHLAAGVPGSVAGMETAHKKYGSLPWETLLQPAIDLAEIGFPITQHQAEVYNGYRETFLKWNDSTSCALIRNDREWQAGDTLRQPDLAETLTRIRDKGATGFYEGKTAELIVAEMQQGVGEMTLQDLQDYEAKWREPVIGEYDDLEIVTMGPPSSGGICLMQMMKMVEDYHPGESGWNRTATVHLMAEAERRAYADRSSHLGDADFYPVPQEGMLADDYLKDRMKSFSPKKASSSEEIKAGDPAGVESEETTHFSIVDAQGNAVSITTTINGAFGSKVFVDGAGFLLNNEMDDFSSKPGVPNLYGLVGAEANAIEPGKRMLSSMTPTIVNKKGELWLVVGTPGGSTIITSVFQTILNMQEHGMTMHEAVAAKRFHHQWLPDAIQYEAGALDSITISKLEKMGHEVKLRDAIGRVDAILVMPDGKLEAGADPRGDDVGMGK